MIYAVLTADALFWLVVGSLLVASFAATGARALRQFSRHDLGEICRRRREPERFGEILRGYDKVALGVETVAVLAAALFIVAGSAWLVARDGGAAATPRWLLFNFALWGVIVAAATLWIPRTVARLWAEPLLFGTWRIWRILSALTLPLVACARALDVILHRLAGRTPEEPSEESFEEEIRTIVSEGHREGLLEEDAREMIEGVIELGDADVSEIMTPRTDMHMLHVGRGWDEVVADVIEAGHTRVPVYDKTRDDIIGILYSKDLLPELAQAPGESRRPIREILRKPIFVPETKAVDDLLKEFQLTRNHMAIVLDEYGGVSGLVTIEDVLEEIVGEIADEYDEEVVAEIKKIDDDVVEALGRAHIDEINEALGLALPDDGDFDTIGGFVFSELGRIPTTGEVLEWNRAVRLTVLEATHRRIDRVRIERIGAAAREIA